MFDQFLLTINAWMGVSFTLAVAGSFLWGLVSVLFSPCHLVSIPLIVGYVAGQKEVAGSSAALAQRMLAAKGMQKATYKGRKVAGFLVVFIGAHFIISPYYEHPF